MADANYNRYLAPTTKVKDDLGAIIQSPFTEQTFQSHALGTPMIYRGTTFYYGSADSTGVGIGLGVTSSAPVTNHLNVTVSAAVAIGGTAIVPTMGATATVLNEYADGVLWVNDVDGQGQCRRIKSNTAAVTSGTPSFVLYDPLTIALTTSSQITVIRHPLKSMVVAATTLTGAVQGTTVIPITASYWGWFATEGYVAVLVDTGDTLVIGEVASIVAATAADDGAAGVADITSALIGHAPAAGTATEYSLVDLNIRGWRPVAI